MPGLFLRYSRLAGVDEIDHLRLVGCEFCVEVDYAHSQPDCLGASGDRGKAVSSDAPAGDLINPLGGLPLARVDEGGH